MSFSHFIHKLEIGLHFKQLFNPDLHVGADQNITLQVAVEFIEGDDGG